MSPKTAIIHNEMKTMKTRLISQAKNFATCAIDKAAKAVKKEMTILRQTLSKTMATLEFTDMLAK